MPGSASLDVISPLATRTSWPAATWGGGVGDGAMWKGGAGLGGPSRFGFARSGDGARVTCLVLGTLVAATAGARGRVIVVVAGGGAVSLGKIG